MYHDRILLKEIRRKGMLKKIICTILTIIIVVVGFYGVNHMLHVDDLPVLGYHNVVSNQEKETTYKDDRYAISESMFTQRMQYLYDNNYKTLTMEEVADYYYNGVDIPKKSVVITFDDGYRSVDTLIKPILEKYDFCATTFVIGSNAQMHSPNYLGLEELVNDETMEYYSHTYNLHTVDEVSHKKKIETLTKQQLQEDFDNNPVDSKYLAYPYGVSTPLAREVVKENNVILAFGYNKLHNVSPDDDATDLPRYMIVDITPYVVFVDFVE